jgi:hypothetical protein
MQPNRETPTAADLTTELGNSLVGLGILTMQIMPFAIPGLLLGLLLVLPLLPLALLFLPFWLAWRAIRALRRLLHRSPSTETTARVRPGTGSSAAPRYSRP